MSYYSRYESYEAEQTEQSQSDSSMDKIEKKDESDKNLTKELQESNMESAENVIRELTEEEKQNIKDTSGWSEEVIDYIRSWDEYEIYEKAGLQEVEIGEKKCLIRDDVDWERADEKGRTNAERIQRGLAPLDNNGEAIQLHHIGQHAESPLAELTFEEHRCNGNDTVLHDKSKETETHGEGNKWDAERKNYWQNRSNYNEEVTKNG